MSESRAPNISIDQPPKRNARDSCGRAEMRGDGGEVVVDQRPLQQVHRVRVSLEVLKQTPESSGYDEDMAIQAKDEFAVCFGKHEVLAGGCA